MRANEAFEHLRRDKFLGSFVEETGVLTLQKKASPWRYLVYSILAQQLSTSVARVLRQRLEDKLGNAFSPEELLALPFEELRSIGLSNSKTNYIRNVASFASAERMDHKYLSGFDDESVISYVTTIKGVGRWTAEMMLMFCLAREDVFPADDLGIQQAMTGLYAYRRKDKKMLRNWMHKRSADWRPFRTYACLYLWRWKGSP